MPSPPPFSEEFEPATPACERPQTYSLDRAATFLHYIPFFFLSGNGVANIYNSTFLMLDPDFSQSSIHASEKVNQFSHYHISLPNLVPYLISCNVSCTPKPLLSTHFSIAYNDGRTLHHSCIAGKLPNVSALITFLQADVPVKRHKSGSQCATRVLFVARTWRMYSVHNGLPFLLCCTCTVISMFL